MGEAPAVTDISNCTICLGGLIKPRILPCSHFFCENCLSEHITSTVTEPGQNVYNCPVCRRSVETEDPTMEKSRWVSFLPMKVTPDVPITFKESKTQHCHPCERRKIKVNANMWCSECSEAFCHSCSDVHCNMKISSSHQTISITNEDLDEKFDKLFLATGVVEHGEFCSIHNGRRIEMYCKDHGQAICIQCLSSDHRKCEKLEMIDTLDDLKDESLNTFKSELGKLLNAVKTLAEEKTENKRAIQTMFTSIESQSLATITELKMKLDDLYIEFLKKADELQSELDQTLKTLSKYSVVLEEKIRNVELVTRFGSKVQALRVTNAIKCEMGKIGENLFPMLLKSTEYKARGNFDTIVNTLNNITELGSISISKNNKESTCSGDIRKFQDLLVTDSRVEFCNVCLVLNSILECPHKTIKSSVYLDKETCAVLTIDKLLQIGLYTNEILNSESVNNESKKLCFDPDKNILFGTLYNASGIYCTVKGKQLIKNKNFKFGEMVCGVDICEGNLYIITEKAILQSQDIKNIQTWMTASISGYRDDISFDAKSKRFSFMIFGGKILFANMSDKSVRHYQGDFKINKPQSIAFGPSGMLFVADSPNLIHVISPDEKNVRALLPKLQKIKTVSDITVSHDKKKLLISGGSYVEIYDIVNEKF